MEAGTTRSALPPRGRARHGPGSSEDLLLLLKNDGHGQFADPERTPAPGGPHSIAAGDLDADGDLDLVLGNAGERQSPSSTVQVALNRGNGAFDPSGEFLTGSETRSLVLGDLDADGRLDVVAAGTVFSERPVSHLTVLRGREGARFAEPIHLSTGVNPDWVDVADLDGDANLDVAASNRGDPQGDGRGPDLTVLYHPGRPAFMETASYRGGGGPLVIIDLDGDGRLDLASTSTFSGTVAVLKNRNLAPASRDCNRNGVPDECDLSSGASPDLDGDGVPDSCQTDCNHNAVPDAFEIQRDSTADCNGNGIPDDCDLAAGLGEDCNQNGRIDRCEIDAGSAGDLDRNGVPDACQPDCDANGVPDALDLSEGRSKDCNLTGVPDSCELASGSSRDGNRNGIPDECEVRPRFHRGDANGDAVLDISDGLCVLQFLFLGGPDSRCPESEDANNDGAIDCTDAVFVVSYLFLGTEPPPPPGPPPLDCGEDRDPLGSPGDLGCESYPSCR